MRRVSRRKPRRAIVAAPPDVERYFGPATIEVVTARGTWAPRVDTVGLGWADDVCTLEVVLYDGQVRPTLPWWLRMTAPAQVTLHGVKLQVATPTLRRRGRRTILRWTGASDALRDVLRASRSLTGVFGPMLQQPLGAEQRAVVRDYLLGVGDRALARWFS